MISSSVGKRPASPSFGRMPAGYPCQGAPAGCPRSLLHRAAGHGQIVRDAMPLLIVWQPFQVRLPSSVSRRIKMFRSIMRLLMNEDGATAIEYGLIAALIAVAAVTVMGTVGTNLSNTFNTVATDL